MEQKKSLWIILATGLFLIAVLIPVINMYKPIKGEPAYWTNTPNAYVPGAQSYAPPANPFENTIADTKTEDSAQTPAVTPEDTTNETPSDSSIYTDNVNVYSQGETSVFGTTIDLNFSKNSAVSAANDAARAMEESRVAHETAAQQEKQSSQATQNTSQSSTPVVQQTQPSQTQVTQSSSTTPAPQVTTPAPASSRTTSGTTSTSTSRTSSTASSSRGGSSTQTASSTQTTQSTSASSSKVVPQASYWVQVASYTTKKNADEARELLAESKLPAEVFTYTDSSNNLYYRVRVGPYTTESEAKYWQAKIQALDFFKSTQSYITNSSAPQQH